MKHLEELRARIPEPAKDVRLNLQSLLETQSTLAPPQRWGVAVAAAVAARNPELTSAVAADARAVAGDAVVEDALAAAALMAMNNVFYRARHMLGKESFATRPARLRMNRLGQPKSTKMDLELYSLAASAIGGCEVCLQAHDKVALEAGFTEEQVLDALRIAAVIHAAAVALEMAPVAIPDPTPTRSSP